MRNTAPFLLVLLTALAVSWPASVILAAPPAVAAPYVFRHWGAVSGMYDDHIHSFAMTADHRLLVRSANSVDLFDGARFRTFHIDRRRAYRWDNPRTNLYRNYTDRSGRVWLKSPGLLTVFDARAERFVYDVDSLLRGMGAGGRIRDLFIDSAGDFWFVSSSGALLFHDVRTRRTRAIHTRRGALPLEIAAVRGRAVAIYDDGVACEIDKRTGRVLGTDATFRGHVAPGSFGVRLAEGHMGDLWLLVSGGIWHRAAGATAWQQVDAIAGESNFFTDMDIDTAGDVWAGTSWSGMRHINGRTLAVERIDRVATETGGLINNDIQSIYADEFGGVWVALLWQGLCYYNPRMFPFRTIHTVASATDASNESVRCLLQDTDGTVLIGTSRHGLQRYNPLTGAVSKAFAAIPDDALVLSLYRDRRGRLWVCTYLHGFYVLDAGAVLRYGHDNAPNAQGTHNIARAVYEDADGRLWVSVRNQGVGELDPATGRVRLLSARHPELGTRRIDYGFYPDGAGRFAVYGENGIYYYDTRRDRVWLPPATDTSGKFAGLQMAYNCVLRDSRGLEWFCTDMGVRVWDPAARRAYTIGREQGLPNGSASAVVEDTDGCLWVAAINGVSQIAVRRDGDALAFDISSFDSKNGLTAGRINYNAMLRTHDGEVYIGAFNGTYRFSPRTLRETTGAPLRPLLTEVRCAGEEIKPYAAFHGRTVLRQPLHETRELRLAHDENFLTFAFVSPDYVSGGRGKYRYRLEGYDADWTEREFDGEATAAYTGLPAGEYTFRVYAAGWGGVWGKEEAALRVVITPPWWATWWARLFYLAVAAAALAAAVRLYLRRKQEQMRQEAHRKEEAQREQLNQLKFRFFTNISHEFRTPLSLIMTPLSVLIPKADGEMREGLQHIYANAEHLLTLINQLLDFRKLEMGGEHLKLQRCEVGRFVRYLVQGFDDVAREKQLTFTVEGAKEKDIVAWLDKPKLRHILTNLYSNALKFTPRGGHIDTTIALTEREERRFVCIAVADTGCGIAAEDCAKIFDRFYQTAGQADDIVGSGIGLHLVKQYVELHGGTISVRSELGKGSVFTVALPLDLGGSMTGGGDITGGGDLQSPDANAGEKGQLQAAAPAKKRLLIVEDNDEFRGFLAAQFAATYTVLQAADGAEGLKAAAEQQPDIIVTDLMMPVVDGLEMCERIKQDIETSHIPVVVLTARSSDEARIESYKVGADSYVSKPFNFDVLAARVAMLLEKAEQRRDAFHKPAVEIAPSVVAITPIDEEYIKKAIATVEANITDTDFTAVQLGEALNMSRSQLYRKFESISGMSPSDFIKCIRLKRAAQLLRDSELNVSEISDRTGFNSTKYFNKHFKEMWGTTPTQYRKDARGEAEE